jgi:hypothetical protein
LPSYISICPSGCQSGRLSLSLHTHTHTRVCVSCVISLATK